METKEGEETNEAEETIEEEESDEREKNGAENESNPVLLIAELAVLEVWPVISN